MSITYKQLNEYRKQAKEIKTLLKSIRRNIEKNDHQFYFLGASASVYGRVYNLFYILLGKEYVVESVIQPPCHSGITGNYHNIKSACVDIIRRFDELTYILHDNDKYFAVLISELARKFYAVLTIPKNKSL